MSVARPRSPPFMYRADMNMVVTGGAGFIGSALARALLRAGHEVTILDNLSTGRKENLPGGARFLEGDVRDRASLVEALAGAETVFHQAALGSVPRSLEAPAASHESNATGTLNVLVAASAVGARRVVYASSSSCYGPNSRDSQHESDPVNPASPYAVSKLAGEMYCTVWASAYGLETVSLRYFNVFGPGQRADSQYAAVFPRFISALLSNRPPEVYGDGEQARDFTYIQDVVRANILAAESTDASGRVFNIAGGSSRSVNEVLRSVSKQVGTWIPPRFLPARIGDIRNSRADTSAARDTLQWSPLSQWDEAVAETVEWFRHHASTGSA